MRNIRFRISDAAKAANVSADTIRTWRRRLLDRDPPIEMLPGKDAQLAEGKGLPHLISYKGVLRLALMGRLAANGVDPYRAWLSAVRFTDTANAANWDGSPVSHAHRKLGGLFTDGLTVLAIRPGQDVATVRHLDDGVSPMQLMKSISGADGAAVVVVNEVVREIETALSLNSD